MHLSRTKTKSEKSETRCKSELNILESLKFWFFRMMKTEKAFPKQIYIRENLTFEDNAAKNKIWYSGEPDELSQLYAQLGGTGFWCMSRHSKIQKIHTGIPGEMIDVLTQIVISDMLNIEIESNPAEQDILANILKKCQFSDTLETAVSQMLVIGDGAFRIRNFPEKSDSPAVDFVPGDRVQFDGDEIIFLTKYQKQSRIYLLREHYGYGHIRYVLTDADGNPQMLDTLEETAHLQDLLFDENLRLAVPMKFRSSPQYPGRGQSLFHRKHGCFDAVDEAWSQYMNALRKSQPKTYIPSSMAEYNPETGQPLRPNPFDDNYIIVGQNMAENADNQITSIQPHIEYEGYLSAYMTALDLCLQGVLSPSTLGIDVKKLDNADAQREKEKATLYTRNRIISILQKTLPVLFRAMLIVWHIGHDSDFDPDLQISIPFGEYASPSFESQVETLGKAKNARIMSNEAIVDELYGDTKEDAWKQNEIKRLNALDGLDAPGDDIF